MGHDRVDRVPVPTTAPVGDAAAQDCDVRVTRVVIPLKRVGADPVRRLAERDPVEGLRLVPLHLQGGAFRLARRSPSGAEVSILRLGRIGVLIHLTGGNRRSAQRQVRRLRQQREVLRDGAACRHVHAPGGPAAEGAELAGLQIVRARIGNEGVLAFRVGHRVVQAGPDNGAGDRLALGVRHGSGDRARWIIPGFHLQDGRGRVRLLEDDPERPRLDRLREAVREDRIEGGRIQRFRQLELFTL